MLMRWLTRDHDLRPTMAFLPMLMSLWSAQVFAQPLSERLEISGFGRLVVGAHDESNVELINYNDDFSLDKQSLLALQADFKVTDKLSVAAQALAHTGAARESGLEWFYLSYAPNNNWQIKAGRLRTPFINYSDVLDVGYAYPWITAPVGIYQSYLFSNYEGASVSYRSNIDKASFQVEAYYGNDESTVQTGGELLNLDVNSLRGVIAQLQFDNFKLRASYHNTNSLDVGLPQILALSNALNSAGFPLSAKSLNLNGGVTAFQVGARYDDLDYFAETEYLTIDSDIAFVAPIDSYYVTVGRSWRDYQFHLTLGESSADTPTPENEIPLGLDPQLDGLASIYRSTFDAILVDNIRYYQAGIRWDVSSHVALKAEVTRVSQDTPSSYFTPDLTGQFDNDAVLTQFAVEWVF